ncbi:hypothetical protein [Moellerella wisconsensis]|uniref:Uncharacterized protein n=1 Tax=Moellerella wisconsensis TaxID=158849 RepID=A0ACD3Y756_9GAMM|nr:hypothetical protein [Moellerella wisconsensis]UNH38589.1 hypothetical protein MNY70_14125 [Moellerella wisconsensis]
MQWYGVAGAREGDLVSCGKHSGAYHIIGGMSDMWLEDRKHAGTLESFSSCPCHSTFIPSIPDCYSNDDEPAQAKSFSATNEIINPVKEITNTSPQQEASPFILPIQKVCRYCHRPITLSNACKPQFQDIIREFIDAGNDINGVFKELCDYYIKHFDIWKTTYIDTIFSDLHEVIGKNFYSLQKADQKRFWLLHGKQDNTLFYGDKYSLQKDDPGYDKVQHIIAGLWLG